MNELQVLRETTVLNKPFKIYGDEENPVFLAKDVAEWIGHSDVSMMVRVVDENEKGTSIVCTLGGNQSVLFLTEDGMYEVLMQSRLPIAKDFKRQVKAVLKEIRKTGSYGMPKIVTPPDPHYITSVNRSVSLKILSPDQGRAMLFAACNGNAMGVTNRYTPAQDKKHTPSIPPDITLDTLLSAFPGWSEKLLETRCTLERFGLKRIVARGEEVRLAIHHNHKEITKICGLDYKERMRLDPAYIETRQVHICREQVSALMFDWKMVRDRTAN